MFYYWVFCFGISKPQILQSERTLMPHTLASGCDAFWDCGLFFLSLVWSNLPIGSTRNWLIGCWQVFPPQERFQGFLLDSEMLRINLEADSSSWVATSCSRVAYCVGKFLLTTWLRCDENHCVMQRRYWQHSYEIKSPFLPLSSTSCKCVLRTHTFGGLGSDFFGEFTWVPC